MSTTVSPPLVDAPAFDVIVGATDFFAAAAFASAGFFALVEAAAAKHALERCSAVM